MSLKAFHLVFMIVVLLLSLGVGAWGLRVQEVDGQGWPMQLGVASLVLAVATMGYGLWFLKKLKHLSYA